MFIIKPGVVKAELVSTTLDGVDNLPPPKSMYDSTSDSEYDDFDPLAPNKPAIRRSARKRKNSNSGIGPARSIRDLAALIKTGSGFKQAGIDVFKV